jgi:hypothetical protein
MGFIYNETFAAACNEKERLVAEGQYINSTVE